MPIYIESRGIGVNSNPLARHEYLVYVPDGKETEFAEWKTIGAFPEGGDGAGAGGSGSLLFGRNIGSDFINATRDDVWTTGLFGDFAPESISIVANTLGKSFGDVTVSDMVDEGFSGEAEASRFRELVFDGSAQEEGDLLAKLTGFATGISNQFTYKVVDLTGTSNAEVFGPTVNSNSFITSILRSAAADGDPIAAFETSLPEPGNQTWLGTHGDDVLDGGTTFANGDEAQDLFGGLGADTLIAGTGDSYLVAGADTDRDTLIGNAGDDILVGYFNQANYAASDSMSGGAGDDNFVIIDPASALAGGIPDINGTPAAPTNFVHGATSSGGAVLIDGGAGNDVLDYSFLTNDVTVDFTNGSIVNVEGYLGSKGKDVVFADEITSTLGGGEGEDTLTYEKAAEGIVFNLYETPDVSASTASSNGSGNWTANFVQFEKIIGSKQDDIVKIENVYNDLTIIGGGNSSIGDTLDFSASATFLTIDLTPVSQGFASISISPYETILSVKDFSNVVGSAFGDIITGNDQANWIDGGDLGDTIDGGAGTDVLHFAKTGAGVTVDLAAGTGLGGDAQGDTYSNIEVVIGTDSIDHFGAVIDSGIRLAGGDGADIFDLTLTSPASNGTNGAGGPTIVWGGAGADTIKLDSGSRIYVVNAELDEAAFATLDLRDLDASVNWDNIDVIIINPDPSDQISLRYDIFNEIGSIIGEEFVYLDVSNNSYTLPISYVDPNNPLQTNVTTELWDFGEGEISTLGNWSYLVNGEAVIGDGTAAGFLLGPWGWAMVGGSITGTSILATGRKVHLGSAADDTHDGDASDELMAGSGGADVMNGGGGSDTANYLASGEAIVANLRDGFGSGGDAEGDIYSDMENVIGSDFDDFLRGNDWDNQLVGGAGNDILNGHGGDDTLVGGAGNDRLTAGTGTNLLIGGDGNDIYYISGGQDTIIENANEGTDLVISMVDYTLDDNIENARLFQAAGAKNLIGNALNNQIVGNTSNNILDGGAGSDRIYAGGGDNTLIGGEGGDKLFGNSGNDTLVGGAGNDFMIGGSGADIIELDFGSGNDTMADFEDGVDLIDLSATGLVFADLTITDSTAGVLISFDDGDALTPLDDLLLAGVSTSSITTGDFAFS